MPKSLSGRKGTRKALPEAHADPVAQMAAQLQSFTPEQRTQLADMLKEGAIMKSEKNIIRREEMTDIVLELQNMASDSLVKVSDLLRKALVVAKKLKVIDYEPWVTHELYGYLDINGDYELIPQYRHLKSKIDYEIISSISIDYLDPLSLRINPSDPHQNTLDFPCHLSIPEIEKTLEGETKNNFVHIPVQPDIEKLYKEDLKYVHPSEPIVLTVQAFLLTDILEVVRTEIFEWCLELEENGISGEEPPTQTGALESPNDMLTISEAAQYTGKCSRTIYNWRNKIDGDKPMLADVTGKGRFTRIPRKSLTPYRKEPSKETCQE